MLSERLSKLRTEKRKTHQEMADFLGITRPAYTAYESGTRKPDYETLQKLADYFDVSVDYLLGRSNVRKPLEDNNSEDDVEHFFFADGGENWTEEEIEIARQAAKLAVEAYRRGQKKNK